MNQTKKDYKNVLIAGVWATKNGHLSTMPFDAKAVEALRQCVEEGGKVLIRKRSEESIAKSNNPDRSPTYFLEFVPASEVAQFQARNSQDRGL